MKRSPRIPALRVLLILLIWTTVPVLATAQQSERGSRGRTSSSRVERKNTRQAPQRATRQLPNRPSRVQEKAPAPQRTERGTAAQRAPQRTERGTAAQRAPQRTERGTAAQRAPKRTERGTASQRAPKRTERGTAVQSAPRQGNRGTTRVAPRNPAANRDARVVAPRSNRDRRVDVGNRSTLRRPGVRPVVRDRTWVVPRHRYRPAVVVVNRPLVRVWWPRIHVHLDWPWLVRYERHWAPRYRYRQVVRVEVVRDGRRDWSNIEVETFYRHSVRRATADWAEIDIEIDQIDLYDGDFYLGYVDRLPADLRTIRATVYRNGDVTFDREVFLVGDPTVGFEVISTRYYDGWVQDAYRPEDGYRAGRVDLRRHRVDSVRRSRLWNPYRYTGVVPVSLLPDQEGWLWDYGMDALSAGYDDYDWYYGGSGLAAPRGPSVDPGLSGADQWSYRTRDGVEVEFQRDSSLERVR